MTRVRRLVPALFVAVLVGALAAMATAPAPTAAQETSLPIDIHLGVLTPGVPVTDSMPLDVPVDSTVTRAQWVETTGLADEISWSVTMCSATDCFDVTPPQSGHALPAGNYEFAVTGTLNAAALGTNATPSAGTAVGVVELQQNDVLARTGFELPWLVLLLAGSAIATGIVVVAAVRSRERGVQDPIAQAVS